LYAWSEAKAVGDSLWFFTAYLSDSLISPPGFPIHNRVIAGYLNDYGDTLNVQNVRTRYPNRESEQLADQVFIFPDKSKLIHYSLGLSDPPQTRLVLARLNNNDSLRWERWINYDTSVYYVQNNHYRGVSIAPDGSIYLAGGMGVQTYPGSPDSSGFYTWVARTDSFGCLVPGCHLGDSIFAPSTNLPVIQYARPMEVNLYPNPAEDYIQIAVSSEQIPAGLHVAIFNLEGRLIMEEAMESDEHRLGITGIAPGIYLCRLRSAEGVITYRKFVKR